MGWFKDKELRVQVEVMRRSLCGLSREVDAIPGRFDLLAEGKIFPRYYPVAVNEHLKNFDSRISELEHKFGKLLTSLGLVENKPKPITDDNFYIQDESK